MKTYTHKQLIATKKHIQQRIKKVKRHGSAWIAYQLSLAEINRILTEFDNGPSVKSDHAK